MKAKVVKSENVVKPEDAKLKSKTLKPELAVKTDDSKLQKPSNTTGQPLSATSGSFEELKKNNGLASSATISKPKKNNN